MVRELWAVGELQGLIARYRRMYWSGDYYASSAGLRRVVKLLERELDALAPERAESPAGGD